jgi:hypothetical protein
MRGTVPPVLLYVFMAWYLVNHGDNFAFTFVPEIVRSFISLTYKTDRDFVEGIQNRNK